MSSNNNKAIAKSIGRGEYKINCPRCSRQHLLSQVGFDKCILDSDVDDDFTICKGPNDTLYPIFVCRNSRCSFDGVVSFVGAA